MARKIFGKITPLVRENLKVALRSLQNNKLRSLLTIAMITIGITSLVGILTSTEALRSIVNDSFSSMGVNSFTIQSKSFGNAPQGGERRRIRNNTNITYFQVQQFKEIFDAPAVVAPYTTISSQTLSRGDKSTTPNKTIYAVDKDYISFANIEIGEGRNFTENDISGSGNVCILGPNIVATLFNKQENPINKGIIIGGTSYTIVGVIAGEATQNDYGKESRILIPITTARIRFPNSNYYAIGIQPTNNDNDEYIYTYAEQIFRLVRRLSPTDESDFSVRYNKSMVEESQGTLRSITLIAAIIGLITLLGAAVGLMNIMLVSVKERTSEIGVRKAIGASSRIIKQQFLFEAIVIAQIGCLFGVILGVIAGNIVATLLKAPLLLPWGWIFISIVICTIVGVASGYIPAKKAANLDPIEALRYE